MMPDLPSNVATASAVLTNAVGLHARPSVKLTQLAKSFGCRVEIALDAAGPWVDAKSPVKVMRVKAPQGATVHVRATGAGAGDAAGAIIALVANGFEDATGEAGHG